MASANTTAPTSLVHSIAAVAMDTKLGPTSSPVKVSVDYLRLRPLTSEWSVADVDECAVAAERGELLCLASEACRNLEGSYECVCSPGLYPVFVDLNTASCGSELLLLTHLSLSVSLSVACSLVCFTHSLIHSLSLSLSHSLTLSDLVVNERFKEHSVVVTFLSLNEDQVW